VHPRFHAAGGQWLRGLREVTLGPDPAPQPRRPAARWALVGLFSAGLLLLAGTVVAFATMPHGGITAWWLGAPGRKIIGGAANRISAQLTNNGTVRYINVVAVGRVIELAFGAGLLLVAARRPLYAWRVAWLAAFLLPWLSNGLLLWPGLVAVGVVFGVAGWRHSREALWWMWALSLVPLWVLLTPGWQRPLAASLVLTGAAVAVDAAGASHRARRALLAQEEQTELEQARRAVLEERARIARELHDVVAHHMSLIAVQAETARYRLDGVPPAAAAEFGSISDQARQALAEMRRLLGVLRDDRPAARAPQPGLTDVPALVAASRRAGVAVDLAMPDEAGQVPPGVGLCAYRIVQEALANASRHAPGAQVIVNVEGDSDDLWLQVRNGPAASPPAAGPARPGQGLVGMRERVAVVGGSLVTGPTPDGGFLVAASLPLRALRPERSLQSL